jgi:hypothetical protein
MKSQRSYVVEVCHALVKCIEELECASFNFHVSKASFCEIAIKEFLIATEIDFVLTACARTVSYITESQVIAT